MATPRPCPLGPEDAVFVAGIHGMVGSAVTRLLTARGHRRILGHSSAELDLRDQRAGATFDATNRPDVVIDAAARISAMPTNLDGQGDNFDPARSHVLPAVIRRFLGARERDDPFVVCWGSGTPRREFLKPDGTPRKFLEVSRLRDLGWSPRTALCEGVESTYAWFTERLGSAPEEVRV